MTATAEPAHVVEHDRFDRQALARVEGPAGLRALAERGARLLPGWPALVGDLFYVFYKAAARLRPDDDLPPSGRLPRALLGDVMAAPGYAAARRRTMLDEAAAAAAAQQVGDRLLALVRGGELLLEDELRAGHHIAADEAALRDLEAAREALDAMTAEAALDPSDPGPDRLAQRVLEVELDAEIELRREQLAAADARARQITKDLPRDLRARLRGAVDAVPASLVAREADLEQLGHAIGGAGRMDAAARLALGERLARSEKLRKLVALVGAFRRLARVERRRPTPRAGPEVYDVETGQDPARLLAGELAALGHPRLRRDVHRRFVERQLLQYGLRGDDDRGRGPMVVCLDGSGSMRGAKELWAKALTLTLVDAARRQRRACRVIVFSAGHPLFVRDLVDRKRRRPEVEAVIELAEHFPGGGTEFEAPLQAALDALAESRYRRGDVVFVTDGEAGFGRAFEERFAAEKARLAFRVIGVLVDVGHVRAETLARFCDEVQRVSALTGEAAAAVVGRL
ncbi:MAG: VWA domain-containing protein [Myxococcales bacterium]|nr:VWA domain-containing protein [Myxococcales bacterium]